jgi:hypothetical protein
MLGPQGSEGVTADCTYCMAAPVQVGHWVGWCCVDGQGFWVWEDD